MKSITAAACSMPANAGVIAFIEDLAKEGGMVHPDLNHYLNELRKQLSGVALRKHRRSQVLINVETQTIVAVAFGMGYAIKVGKNLREAMKKGKPQQITWSDGSCLDLPTVFGDGWIEGSFDDEEAGWISIQPSID